MPQEISGWDRLRLASSFFMRALRDSDFCKHVAPLDVPPGRRVERPAPQLPAAAAVTPPPAPPTPPPAPPTPPPAPPAPPAVKSAHAAVQLLALLQREGRLVDFLNEPIDSYQDAQIGAAVRAVHKGCKKVLDDYVPLEPVMHGADGERVTVPAGYDPGAIRLIGNVSRTAPVSGTVAHRGWRVRDLKLPPIPAGQDEHVVAAAEVEVN